MRAGSTVFASKANTATNGVTRTSRFSSHPDSPAIRSQLRRPKK